MRKKLLKTTLINILEKKNMIKMTAGSISLQGRDFMSLLNFLLNKIEFELKSAKVILLS